VFADILHENRAMQEVCRMLGFDLRFDPEEGVVRAEISL
jgi:hypothetical protein